MADRKNYTFDAHPDKQKVLREVINPFCKKHGVTYQENGDQIIVLSLSDEQRQELDNLLSKFRQA